MGTLDTMGTIGTQGTISTLGTIGTMGTMGTRVMCTMAPWTLLWAPIGHQLAFMDTNMDTHGYQDYVSIYIHKINAEKATFVRS